MKICMGKGDRELAPLPPFLLFKNKRRFNQWKTKPPTNFTNIVEMDNNVEVQTVKHLERNTGICNDCIIHW